MLRQLAQYHAKNTGHLFMVRIAQGLTHLGKGTLSLSPFHTDRQIMNPVAVAGLLITLVSFLDTKNSKYVLIIYIHVYITLMFHISVYILCSDAVKVTSGSNIFQLYVFNNPSFLLFWAVLNFRYVVLKCKVHSGGNVF